jgi:hypothetical protein
MHLTPHTSQPAKGTSMGVVPIKCADCANSIQSGAEYLCAAPQLAEVLDSTRGYQNEIARCHAARDFKFACGHAARWYRPRQENEQDAPT